MKKFFVALIFMGLVTAFACPSSVDAVIANVEERGYISVSANTTKEINPDVAEFSVQIQTTDTKSMQNAVALNKQISEKVYNGLKSMIAQDDLIKTSNYNATPLYNYNNGKKIFNGYRVTNSVVVRTHNLKDVGAMLDKALALGATNIDNLSFTVSNYDSQCDELLEGATKKASAQASAIARALSSSVAGVKSIDGSCSLSGVTTRVRYNFMEAKAAGSDAISTPIETSTVKIYANVNASFFVK